MKLTKRQVSSGNGEGGGLFLKVEPDQSVTGVFRGEPYEYYQKWPKGGQKQMSDTPFEGAQPRFKLNFVVSEDGKLVAKIFEFGVSVYNQLCDIQDAFKIEETTVKISRQGSKEHTKWFLMPTGPLTGKHLKQVEAVPLNILNKPKTEEPEISGEQDEEDDSEIPF